MPLAFQDVPKPFIGRLDEATELKLLEDGYTTVENGWYEKTGRISKRPGLVDRMSTGIGAEKAQRIASYENQLIATTDTSSLYAGRDADDTWVLQDLIPEATVTRKRIRSEIDSRMLRPDMAIAGAYTVYAWLRDDDGDIYVRIVETSTGTLIIEQIVSTAALTMTSVRLATNGSNVLIVYADPTNNDLYARRIVCSTNPPTIGTETALVTDLNAAPYYDICAMGSGWALVYRDTAAVVSPVLQVVSANPPTIGWSTVLGGDTTFVSCCEVGATLFVAYFNTADVAYVVYNSTTGAAILGGTVLEAAPTQVGPTGIAAVSSTAAMFSWKSNAKLQKWRTGDTAGALGSVHDTYRVLAESKPFPVTLGANDLGIYQWFVTGFEGNGTNSILVLCFLDRTVGNPQIDLRPVAAAAYGVSVKIAGERIELANPAVFSSTDIRIAAEMQLVSGSTITVGDEVRANFADRRRHQAVRYGKSLYLSGGIVTQWDGKQATEVAYIQAPAIISSTPNAAGGSLANGSYQIVVVYEEYDDNGDVHRSIPSEVDTQVVAGADTRIVLTVEPLTITMRQDNAQRLPRVELAVYVTEPNLDVFYRLAAVGSAATNDFGATTGLPTAVVTINIDSVNTANPTLYTTGGILENDAPYGGATILAEHKGRLFAAGGEDVEVIWYSQPRVDGEPALFNLAQQMRIPGHTVTGLASLDDVLVVFTLSAIFCVYGEGPNALGDISSGSFSDPVPLPVDTGAVSLSNEANHAIATCPAGVVFPNQRGIQLLDRSRSVKFLGEPIEDTTSATEWPHIRSAVVVPDQGHVRFVLSDFETSKVAVWDYASGHWALWKYLSGLALNHSCIYLGSYHVLTSTNLAYTEDDSVFTDDGAWYGITIETGWISFGQPGVFKRLRRVGLQINRHAAAGLVFEVKRSGGAYFASTFTEAEITALAEDTLRIHVPEQKGHRYRVRLTETEPSVPGRGISFVNLVFNVGVKGREGRLEAAASK